MKNGAIEKTSVLLALPLLVVLLVGVGYADVGANPQKPRIFVDPKDNTFYTKTVTAGSNFTISIESADWTDPGVFGYELKLYYNNSLLEAVDAAFPKGHWLEPTLPIIMDWPPWGIDVRQDEGCLYCYFTLLFPESARIGGGVLATITFRTLKAPAEDENLTCPLALRDVIFVDPNAYVIPPDSYEIIDGNFLFSGVTLPLREDLNHDGRVNIIEMAICCRSFNARPSEPGWNPNADLNGDGIINIVDMCIIAKAWTW